MTKMVQLVDDMRARLTDVATTEQTLVRALDQALSAVDHQLLADVRDLTLSHEARRVAILQELQVLASRIGAFPALNAPHDQAIAPPEAAPPEHGDVARAGDWRQAVSNIKEEFDTYLGRSVQH